MESLIETVAAITDKNFVVDPRVNAKVTVISAKPMNKDEIYQVFLSVLQVHGFAAVPVGDIVKIVPDITAKQGPVVVTNDGVGDELITRVIPVYNVSAAQLVPILRPLVPQQGHLAAYTSSNVLVISDRAANVDRMATLVEEIDQPITQGIEVIQLEHASASEIVQIITSMQQRDAQLAGGQLPGQPLLVADDRTNSILLTGAKNARLRLRGIIAHLDTPLDTGGNTQVVFLNYAKAKDLADILLGVAEQQQQQQEQQTSPSGYATTTASSLTGTETGTSATGEEISIQADEQNNALIITAPPDQIQNLKNVIRQLDVRRAQVLVESVIAEVSTTLARDLGIQFAALPGGINDLSGPGVLSNLPSGSTSLLSLLTNPAAAAGQIGTGLLIGAADSTSAGDTNFALILQALATDSSTNILSTPTLVTMDNEEAEVVVAQNVPFVTGEFTTPVSTGTTTGGAVSPFTTIERQDVGLTLRLTPQINEGDTIKLAIEEENSSLQPTTVQSASGASDIITNKRSIKTNVLVDDGQVLVLGGLIGNDLSDTEQKVPILGDIPLLGYLFRSNSTEDKKTSLMIFIHPVILRDPALATAYTHSKYDYLRARQLNSSMQNRGLTQDSAGRLPRLNELITQIPRSVLEDDQMIEMTPMINGISQ